MVSRHGGPIAIAAALLAAPATAQVAQAAPQADPMARYLDRTRGAIHCTGPVEDEIVVCARRAADRYRTPIIERDAGDRSIVDTWGDRARLVAPGRKIDEMGPFLVGGGHVGVTMTTALARGARPILREPAP